MDGNRTCERCRFWHRDDPISQHGQCRRYPPSVAMPHGLVRPTMAADNFCGEWRDISITPEQEQRSELVWRMAADYVDAKPKIGGE
jgi:hypothetical protein